MSDYVNLLNAMKEAPEHLAKDIGDQWRTPEWLFQAVNALYGPLVLDLFTDGQNSKCPRFYTAEDNALTQNWAARLAEIQLDMLHELPNPSISEIQVGAYANPPYSRKRAGDAPVTGMDFIMEKAHEERKRGAKTVWVTKSATSDAWFPGATATKTIFIKGRIAFEPPVWFNPSKESSKVSSAGFGASILIFDPSTDEVFPNEYISREELFEIGAPLAMLSEDEREAWIKSWEEI